MNQKVISSLKTLLKKIYKKKNIFYYQKFIDSNYKFSHINQLNQEAFRQLPSTNIKEYSSTPYQNRLLEEGVGFNKLVYSKESDQYILIHKTLKDIAAQKIPTSGLRPMVLIQDVYESIELCLYFYEYEKLPLIGEILNPPIVYATAKQYRVDSLYMDQISAKSFLQELSILSLPLKSLTIIDSKLPFEDFSLAKIKTGYIFSLPYVGIIAYLCPNFTVKKTNRIFHIFDNIFIEPGDKTIITSSTLIANPIIRLEIPVKSTESKGKCGCGKKGYTLELL